MQSGGVEWLSAPSLLPLLPTPIKKENEGDEKRGTGETGRRGETSDPTQLEEEGGRGRVRVEGGLHSYHGVVHGQRLEPFVSRGTQQEAQPVGQTGRSKARGPRRAMQERGDKRSLTRRQGKQDSCQGALTPPRGPWNKKDRPRALRGDPCRPETLRDLYCSRETP